MLSFVYLGIASTILSAGIIYFMSRILVHYHVLDMPNLHRWHSQPTPKFGGVGIFLSAAISIYVFIRIENYWNSFPWGLSGGILLLFFLGIYDDIKPVSAVGKLVIQILAASLVILQGYTTYFFTPRLGDSVLAQLPNTLITFIWLIAITNAINLLDNMDGLAGGISFITTLFLSYLFWKDGDWVMLSISVALGGALAGFLIWNFPPARIFMGDSGSQFIGFTLAILAIARVPQASNVFAIMGVPSLLFLLPILDTTFVTITRILRGSSPTVGGRDHTSHRLIAFGLNERQVLIALYSVAFGCGITAITLEALDYDLSLVLIPLIVIMVLIFTAYLAGVRLSTVNFDNNHKPSAVSKWMIETAMRRNLLEVGLDFFLIAFAYYLVYYTKQFSLTSQGLTEYINSLPLVYISSYLAFFATGIYRELWHYVGAESIYNFGRAAIISSLLLWIISKLVEIPISSPSIFLLGVFLFFGLAVTRYSFRALDLISTRQKSIRYERIVLCGAEEELEVAIQWLQRQNYRYKPIGLVIDQEHYLGKRIHGLPILGSPDDIIDICNRLNVTGVILVSSDLDGKIWIERLRTSLQGWSGWVKILRFQLSELDKESRDE